MRLPPRQRVLGISAAPATTAALAWRDAHHPLAYFQHPSYVPLVRAPMRVARGKQAAGQRLPTSPALRDGPADGVLVSGLGGGALARPAPRVLSRRI